MQCGREPCPCVNAALVGFKERKINASHSLQTAGTYIHLIALHNGFHKPLIIRLYVRN